MVTIIKQKRSARTITVVETINYRRADRMVTIGKIPKKLQGFFKPLKRHFYQRPWQHFWGLVLAITISHAATIDRLAKALRGSTHRTNHGEFLWRSCWDNSTVMQQIALDMLMSLFRKKDPYLFFIIDDTQTLKRAKKMAAVGKLLYHTTGKYGTGHTIVKVSLYYRGVTIPWGSWLYIKKEKASGLDIPFQKLTDLAAQAVTDAHLPDEFEVTVLFDAFYLCPKVVNACREKNWHFIGVGKSNRWFTVGSRRHKLGRYGRNVLRNSGRWCNVKGLRRTQTYQLAQRIGTLKKTGLVKVVFSRRRGEHQRIALVTDNLRASMKSIVADYLKRWSIEILLKDQKQHLGLGDYRVLRYQAIVRHLHLVDVAYACLTHIGIKAYCAQGQNKRNNKVLRMEPISMLKNQMRKIVWQENVKDVIKYSHEKPVIRRLEKLLAA